MFVESTARKSPYLKVGRMLIQDGKIRVIIDGRFEFWMEVQGVRGVILGLGKARIWDQDRRVIGEAELSSIGSGLWMVIDEEDYVTPGARVKAVLSGEHRKAPVFVMDI